MWPKVDSVRVFYLTEPVLRPKADPVYCFYLTNQSCDLRQTLFICVNWSYDLRQTLFKGFLKNLCELASRPKANPNSGFKCFLTTKQALRFKASLAKQVLKSLMSFQTIFPKVMFLIECVNWVSKRHPRTQHAKHISKIKFFMFFFKNLF